MAKATKKKELSEAEQGVPLAPSAKDLKPWYNTSALEEELEPTDPKTLAKLRRRKDRDVLRKTSHDPLTSINQRLASTSTPSKPRRPPGAIHSSASDPHAARMNRESSERERALALIARKKKEREAASMLTPSTTCDPSEYGDMFNGDAVQAARKGRERGWGTRSDPREQSWGSGQRHDRMRKW